MKPTTLLPVFVILITFSVVTAWPQMVPISPEAPRADEPGSTVGVEATGLESEMQEALPTPAAQASAEVESEGSPMGATNGAACPYCAMMEDKMGGTMGVVFMTGAAILFLAILAALSSLSIFLIRRSRPSVQ